VDVREKESLISQHPGMDLNWWPSFTLMVNQNQFSLGREKNFLISLLLGDKYILSESLIKEVRFEKIKT